LPKVLGVENDQMIRALAPDRPDQAFKLDGGLWNLKARAAV